MGSLTIDDLDAARAAGTSGYDAAMRSAPGKLLLIVAVVLLAGCSLGLSSRPPASFARMLEEEGVGFTVANPEPGVMDPAVVVRELSDRPWPTVEIGGPRHPFVGTKATPPIFGLLRCAVPPPALCSTFDLAAGGATKGYYLVFYPEWIGPGGDPAWALVDANLGVRGGVTFYDPRQ